MGEVLNEYTDIAGVHHLIMKVGAGMSYKAYWITYAIVAALLILQRCLEG